MSPGRISEPCRIVLGDPAENPVHLNLQDWYMSEGECSLVSEAFWAVCVYVASTPAPYVNGKMDGGRRAIRPL